LNDAPSETRLGGNVGDYRFEVIQYRFPAYTSVDGRQMPAESKTGIWIGKFYFERSTPVVVGVGALLILMALLYAS
jgi:hypothetical protein